MTPNRPALPAATAGPPGSRQAGNPGLSGAVSLRDAPHVETTIRPAALTPRRAPGDVLLHPVMLAALALLILNDHVLKRTSPGPITGKLSDVAGLVVLPVVLVAAWELLGRNEARRASAGRTVILLALAVTGIGFAIVKTQAAAADAFGLALGMAQWLPVSLQHLAIGEAIASIGTAPVLADPTDLIALPALGVAAWLLRSQGARDERHR